jgi:hypothetical protein
MKKEKYVDLDKAILESAKKLQKLTEEFEQKISPLFNSQLFEIQKRTEEFQRNVVISLGIPIASTPQFLELQKQLKGTFEKSNPILNLSFTLPPNFYENAKVAFQKYNKFKKVSLDSYESKMESLKYYLQAQGQILPENQTEFFFFWMNYAEQFLGLNIGNCTNFKIKDYDFTIYTNWRICRLENISPCDSNIYVWENIDNRNLNKNFHIVKLEKRNKKPVEPDNSQKYSLATVVRFLKEGNKLTPSMVKASELPKTHSLSSIKRYVKKVREGSLKYESLRVMLE